MSGGFLRRWSERKAATREAEAQRSAPGAPTEDDLTTGAAGAEPHRPPSDAALMRKTGTAGSDSVSEQSAAALSPPELDERLAALPRLDEIGPETDIRPFLQSFVPATLRKAAMRRAWSADPIISTHLDVARDYAWEFNSGDLPVGFSRALGSQSVQRSLDALGKIGAEPLEKPFAVKGDAEDEGSCENKPSSSDKTEDAASETAAPLPAPADDVAATEAGIACPPEPVEPAATTSPPGLVLRTRHGSALPD